MEDRGLHSTPAASGVANASNCGHFYNDFSGLRVPTATGGGVTFGPYQSLGGSHPMLPRTQWSPLRLAQ